MNYVDKNGLSRFFEKLKTLLANKVDKVSGKGLSTNDYTTTEKNKLAGLTNYTLPTASSSVLGGVKVGSNLSISSGVLSANVPTKTSQLTNDSGFLTSVPSEYVTETELNAKGYITEADITSQTTTITIAASAWSAEGKYTVSDNRITATSNQEFCFPVYNGEEDDEMFDAIEAAKIRNGGQSAGSAILWCQGDIPTIQIKLDIIFRGEK